MQSIYLNYIMLLFFSLTFCFFLLISFFIFSPGCYCCCSSLCVGMCVSVLPLSSHHSFEYNFNACEWNNNIETHFSRYARYILIVPLIWINKRVQNILMSCQNRLNFSRYIKSAFDSMDLMKFHFSYEHISSINLALRLVFSKIFDHLWEKRLHFVRRKDNSINKQMETGANQWLAKWMKNAPFMC